MKCTICQSPLLYKGGENKEDFGCSNSKCKRFDIQYYGNVKVRDGWYFLASYHLPFEYIDTHWKRPDYFYHWYALVGDGYKTHLQGLKLVDRCGIPSWNKDLQDYSASTYKECRQETLHSILYYALPANDDFNHQFNMLRDRMMNEWFSQAPKKSKQDVDDDDWWYVWYNSGGSFTGNQKQYKATKIGTSVDVDSKTKALIELAANNTNANEASNAAMEACKRLRKILKSN